MPRFPDRPLAAALLALVGAGVISALSDDGSAPATSAASAAPAATTSTSSGGAATTSDDDAAATTTDDDGGSDDHGGDDHGGEDDATTTTDGTAAAPAATTGGAASSGAFADGTYAASGSYQSPAGQETVKVSLTIAGDRVKSVQVTPGAQGGNSKGFQDQFAGGISAVVVGKPLAGLQVDKVSGSSLTSGGFNQAVEQIQAEAKG